MSQTITDGSFSCNFLRNIPKQLLFLMLLTQQIMFCCGNVLFVGVSCKTYKGSRQFFHIHCILDFGQNDLNLTTYQIILITEVISFACTLRKAVNSFSSICSTNLVKATFLFLSEFCCSIYLSSS